MSLGFVHSWLATSPLAARVVSFDRDLFARRISSFGINSSIQSGTMTLKMNNERIMPVLKIQCVPGEGCAEIVDFEAESKRPSQLFYFTEEDMQSDESLWETYKRWIAHCEHSRSPEEMRRKFDEFKSSVMSSYEEFTSGEIDILALNNLADLPYDEYLKLYCVPLVY